MPEFTTHYLFGESITEKFSPEIISIIKNNYSAYKWGLQGPDLLFYSNVILDSGRIARAGVALHHKNPDEILLNMLGYIKQFKNKPEYGSLCSYFYGFVCHYALDSTVHPYVYSLIIKLDGQMTSTRHIKIESEIGSLLYHRITNKPVSSFNIYDHYSKNGEFIKPVSEMYVYLIKTISEKTVSKRSIKNSFSFCLFLNKFTYLLACEKSNSKVKTAFLKSTKAIVELWAFSNSFIKSDKVENDTLNLMHEEWCNLNKPEIMFSDSFPELFDMAIDKALNISRKCDDMLESGKFYSLDISEKFDNGEPIKRVRLKPEGKSLLKFIKSRA
jgi:hypothetical protein